MWSRRFATNRRWWLAATAILFLAGSWVNWFPEAKGPLVYWYVWWVFVSGQYQCSTADMVVPLAVWTVILAVPAIVLGWTIQAVAVAVVARLRGEAPTQAIDV